MSFVQGVFRGVDGFGRIVDDVKVKTRGGAILTVMSALLIFTLTLIELVDYRRVIIDESVIVDRSGGEKLTVKMNITFWRVPCYLLSLDVTDISGEIHQDVNHNIAKTRLDLYGIPILEKYSNRELDNEVEKTIKSRASGYCGSCYGASPPKGGCCQTCESVRQAYMSQGWNFEDPDHIEQCVAEHWTSKIQSQSTEGCRISGRVRINKVTGNFHFSPGRSYVSNKEHLYDLVPYLKDGSHHDFGHHIHEFHFEGDSEAEDEWRGGDKSTAWRGKVGLDSYPLDGVVAHVSDDRYTASNYMFQYFTKVVSTEFKYLDGHVVRSNQYSLTSFERDLTHESMSRSQHDAHGAIVGHAVHGLPGAYFNFEISPLMVVHRETRSTFSHFVTS